MKIPTWLRTAGALGLAVGITLGATAGANALETAATAPAAAPEPAAVVEAAPAVAPMALPGGWHWQTRPEAIFDRRALILPPGSTLTRPDAAALLGVASVTDSGWPANPAPAGRVTLSGGGWTGGAGAWALIENSGRYGQLYVLWR